MDENTERARESLRGQIGRGQEKTAGREMSKIEKEIDVLSRTVGRVEKTICVLSDKVSSVCFIQPPTNQTEVGKAIVEKIPQRAGGESDIARKIRSEENRLDDAERKITDILNKIEL